MRKVRKPKLRYNYPAIKGDDMILRKHHLETSYKGSILRNDEYSETFPRLADRFGL